MHTAHRLLVGVLATLASAGLSTLTAGQSPPLASQPSGYVGQDACATCHDDLATTFARSPHGALAPHELRGQPAGCEACHGPGARHAETGAPKDIRSFADLAAAEASRACTACHLRDRARDWPGSEHAMGQVACSNCHRIHPRSEPSRPTERTAARATVQVAGRPPTASLASPEPELCFTCHPGQRARILASSHHPVREGRMTCSSCHDVHGSVHAGDSLVRSTERRNDLCLGCHPKHQGPFIFEHPPVEEDCTICHDPHGTVANNLLKQGEPFLCLQCHEMHFHNARLAPATPYWLPVGGSLNPNGPSGFQRAFGTRCTVCHTRIHGSDMPSTGVSGRGKALIR